MTASFECTLVQVSSIMPFPSRQIIQNFLKGLRKNLPTKFWQIAHNSQKNSLYNLSADPPKFSMPFASSVTKTF